MKPRLRGLVAGDETIIRLGLWAPLGANGLEVCAEARDGEEAVVLARTTRPDVAILDIRMPKLDGLEAARRIIDDRPIPIVMLTAFADEETVSRAVVAGVYAYLTKPIHDQDVMPAIRTALARHAEHAASKPRIRIDVQLPPDR